MINNDLKWMLITLFKVLLFEIIVGTIANILGVEYRPSRYFERYYYPRPQRPTYLSYYSKKEK